MAILTIKKGNGIAQPTTWYSDAKKLVIVYSKEPVLLSRGILKQKERQMYHLLQRRFYEYRTLVPNNFIQQISSVSTEQ